MWLQELRALAHQRAFNTASSIHTVLQEGKERLLDEKLGVKHNHL